MRKWFGIFIIIIICSSCVSILKPITDSRYDLISDYESEFELNDCEINFISVVFMKRIFEKRFPNNLIEMESLIISEQAIDSLIFYMDKSILIDSVQLYYDQAYLPWKEKCMNNYEKFELLPHGLDSVDLSWRKRIDYEDGKRKEYLEEWRLVYESDTVMYPTLLNIEVVLFSSKGKEINSIRGNEDKIQTKQIPMGG